MRLLQCIFSKHDLDQKRNLDLLCNQTLLVYINTRSKGVHFIEAPVALQKGILLTSYWIKNGLLSGEANLISEDILASSGKQSSNLGEKVTRENPPEKWRRRRKAHHSTCRCIDKLTWFPDPHNRSMLNRQNVVTAKGRWDERLKVQAIKKTSSTLPKYFLFHAIAKAWWFDCR